MVSSFSITLTQPVTLDSFSRDIFGLDYASLAKIIYSKSSYISFSIHKKNGNLRNIDRPKKDLLRIQRQLLNWLNTKGILSSKSPAHGFVKGRSVVTNAKVHLDKNPFAVIHLDIKDFFTSITFYRVRGLFLKEPFKLPYKVATVCAHICCYNGYLPQGAPTSPFISNLICYRMDKALSNYAKTYNAFYSRYADDLTFSLRKKDYEKNRQFFIERFDDGWHVASELKKIFLSNTFELNDSKTYALERPGKLVINNIKINQKLNLERSYVDEIRGILHSVQKYGWAKAQDSFIKRQYAKIESSERVNRYPACQIEDYLRGKLLYLKMVKGSSDSVASRLVKKFNSLNPSRKISYDWKVTSFDEAKTAVYVLDVCGDYVDGDYENCITNQGTAFAVRDQKTFLTCNHVLQDSDDRAHVASVHFKGTISLINPQQPTIKYKCRCVSFDKDRDYAFLEVLEPMEEHHLFQKGNSGAEDGYLFGFPDWCERRSLELRKTKILSRYPRSGRNYLSCSANIGGGQSGGALVNENFQVLGIIIEGAIFAKNNNICLDINEVKPTF